VDLAILQKIAQELNELLPGGFINKIYQPLPREIVLRIRFRTGGEKKLMLSADPLLGRIHVTNIKIPNPPSPPRFCAYLRAHLLGARIIEVAAASDDRVVRIITVRGSENERQERDLVLELLGRDSNILLVDRHANKIMDCLHHIPEKEVGRRTVLPGLAYAPPPPRAGRETASLYDLHANDIIPGITRRPKGKSRLTLEAAASLDECFSSMNEAADAFFGSKLESYLLESFRRELAGPLKARIDSLNRRLKKIEADARRLEQLAERGEEGELLKANLKRVQKGMTSLEVEDWTDGERRAIALDPALDAVANMDRIFKKAAKGKRGEKKVQERIVHTLEEKRALEDLLYFLGEASNITELERLALEVPTGTQQKTKSPAKTKAATPASESALFREVRTQAGTLVLVGKSAKGNDFLLRKKSRKGDLWFHVKDFAGSHVIIRREGSEPILMADMETAAALAVHFSKARGKGKVEVIMADVSDLAHPKGAFPGQVTVKTYKTLVSKGLSDSELEEVK
jgi:predicted ribosome quality control (RQC) complex YloA/Tae2 family protein